MSWFMGLNSLGTRPCSACEGLVPRLGIELKAVFVGITVIT